MLLEKKLDYQLQVPIPVCVICKHINMHTSHSYSLFFLSPGVFGCFSLRRVASKRALLILVCFTSLLVITERGYFGSAPDNIRLIGNGVLNSVLSTKYNFSSTSYKTSSLTYDSHGHANDLTETISNLTHIFFDSEAPDKTKNISLNETSGEQIFPYEYLINERGFCSRNQSDLYIINIVGTAPWEFMARARIRRLWGNTRWQNMTGFRTLFFLGEVSDPDLMKSVKEESDSHSDIVQFNFLDTYDNLTLKTLCCLHWLHHYCPSPAWVLKSDVDVVVNIFELSR